MEISTNMKRTADSIVGAYDSRINALGNLLSGVHETLNDFASNRKKSSSEQGAALSGFANAMTRGVTRMLRDFHDDHGVMATEQAASLRRFDAEVENEVAGLLKGFGQNHARMSRKLHSDLNDCTGAIAKETRCLLSGFRREQDLVASDLKATHSTWRDMTRTMAARRHGGKATRREASPTPRTAPEVRRRTHPRPKAR
jgi:hypothetical protein